VKNRFFADQAFFRYVPGFIVQFGIPANPALTKLWNEATIKDDPFKESNKKGTVVFARTGAPNSRSTQFFINLKDNMQSLDQPNQQGFTPFGTVVEGMDVVEGLYSGYGEGADMGGRGPVQGLIVSQGKAYLDKNFPKLDRILSTTITSPETTSTPATPKKSTGAPATKGGATPPAAPKK
jgi:peptidyl-prolyl cis-trans isomerase A (cyclophilin A)